jgi:hypothetical protein
MVKSVTHATLCYMVAEPKFETTPKFDSKTQVPLPGEKSEVNPSPYHVKACGETDMHRRLKLYVDAQCNVAGVTTMGEKARKCTNLSHLLNACGNNPQRSSFWLSLGQGPPRV